MFFKKVHGKSLKEFRKNEHIFRKGEYAYWIYYVLEGSIHIYNSKYRESRRTTFDIINKGRYFGFLESISNNKIRRRSAEVLSDKALIQRFRSDDFVNRLRDDEAFYTEIMNEMNDLRNSLWNRYYVFSRKETLKKIGWALIHLG